MTAHAENPYTPQHRESPLCIICSQPLTVRLAKGRKSQKPFVMLICSQDGRHFRAFVNYQPYVAEVLKRLEKKQ